MKPFQDITDPALAKALAHPLRTRILAALESRTASPSELAEELDAGLGVLSYHVRRLEALGLVRLVKRVPRRGAVEHLYTAVARPRVTSETWGTTPGIVKEAVIRSAIDQIGHYVGTAAASGGFEPKESHLTRSPVIVDAEGFTALADALDAFQERIKDIEADSKRRLARSNHRGEQHATVVLMLFESPANVAAERPASGTRAAQDARRSSAKRASV